MSFSVYVNLGQQDRDVLYDVNFVRIISFLSAQISGIVFLFKSVNQMYIFKVSVVVTIGHKICL